MNTVARIEISSLEIELIASAQTPSSSSFHLISVSRSLGAGSRVGWIDVHYPCAQHIRLLIRAVVPDKLLNARALEMIATEVKTSLGIPSDETMEIEACSPKAKIGISHSADRTGKPGRIETTRKFNLPSSD